MKTAIVTGSILLALVGRAESEPGRTVEPKSEGVARGLSIGATAVSAAGLVGGVLLENVGQADTAAMVILGSMVGAVLTPSAGHWYAGKIFTRGMGVRALGLVVFAVGIAFHDDVSEGDNLSGTGPLFLIGSFGLLAAGAIDDIVTAPRRVRRHNQEAAELAIAPIVSRGGAGLALGGSF